MGTKQNIVEKDQTSLKNIANEIFFPIFVLDKKIMYIKREFWLKNLLKGKKRKNK